MIAEGEEDTTQHFRGKWFGFGPIQDEESIAFAVFEKTERNGHRLSLKSFDRKKLAGAEQSIARRALVSKTVFDLEVARKGESSKGKFIGLAVVSAGAVRSIFCEDWPLAAPKKIFGFGVLDLVEQGDFDAHGTIGFLMEATVPKTREVGALREFLMFDLADKFSEIRSINDYDWGSVIGTGAARIATVYRALMAG
jgi:hypothetical protein